MSAHVERIFRILKMIPINKNGITVSEIKRKLESDHKIFVHDRTIQRDMNLLSVLHYDDIDCFEDVSNHTFRWFRKKASIPVIELPAIERLDIIHKSDFRKNCDDIAWFLSEDFVFNAIKMNKSDFRMNELFNGFYILNDRNKLSNENKIIVIFDENEAAEDLLKNAMVIISNESSKLESILFYINIEKSAWDIIIGSFINIESILKNKGIEIALRFRNKNENNDRELFNEFLQAYRYFEEVLKAKIVEKLSHWEKKDLNDDLFEVVGRLEEIGKQNLFEEYNERLLDDFYNEWGSFLLNMAKKNLPSIRISNDAIGFDCDDSSNCENIFSIRHDQIWVFGEIQDQLCRHFGIY